MKAMVLEKISPISANPNPLKMTELPDPVPGKGEVLIRVSACGVCHTELDEIEGRTPPSFFPMVLGHEIVGRVIQKGPDVSLHRIGDRVGVGWIYSSCERCVFCKTGLENLCSDFRATGRDAFGGYAEYMKVPETSVFKIPDLFSDFEAAPLLCAGAIGYRSINLSGLKDGQNLGFTGFGASAHLVLKMVRYQFPNSKIFVFARSKKEQTFSKELGAAWAGDTEDASPEKLHCIIDTTPVWKPVVEAMKNLKPAGRLVINAIRKEDVDKDYLLKLDYPLHVWQEKEIKSVANVTGNDIAGFIKLAEKIPLKPEVQEYPLHEANRALVELKEGKIRGAKVLIVNS